MGAASAAVIAQRAGRGTSRQTTSLAAMVLMPMQIEMDDRNGMSVRSWPHQARGPGGPRDGQVCQIAVEVDIGG